jgi:hypothetical protein
MKKMLAILIAALMVATLNVGMASASAPKSRADIEALLKSLEAPAPGAAQALEVSDLDGLKAAFADPDVQNVKLTGTIPINEDITFAVNGDKYVRSAEKYHFSIADGKTVDFNGGYYGDGSFVVLEGGGKAGGVTGRHYTLKNVVIAGVVTANRTAVVNFDYSDTEPSVLDGVIIARCVITNNSNYAPVYQAGYATLTVRNCIIQDNTAPGETPASGVKNQAASAIRALCGGDGNGGKLIIESSRIIGNSGGAAAVSTPGGSDKLVMAGDSYIEGNAPRETYPENAVPPAVRMNAWKQADYGMESYPVASGELVTDDILWLEAATDPAPGSRKIEWRVRDCEDGSDWSGWREGDSWKSCFDFIHVVGDQTYHKTYEFRAVRTAGGVRLEGEAVSFEVNIKVKNEPALVAIDGTLKEGSDNVYVSPVTVTVEGRHVTEGTGYFLYFDGSGYVYRHVRDHGLTFTEPGVYSYVRYFDSRSQQMLLGDFTIEEPAAAPVLTFALGGFKADGGVNYSVALDPFADKMDGKALKYVLIDGDKVTPLGAAAAPFEKSNIKLMDYAGKTVTIRAQNGDALNAALVYAEAEYTFPAPQVKLDVATHNNNSAKWMANYKVEGVSAASGVQIKWRLYRPETGETITLTGGSPGAQASFPKTDFYKGETVIVRAYTANPPATLLGEAEHTFTEGKERPLAPLENLQNALDANAVVDGNGFTYNATPMPGSNISAFLAGLNFDTATLKNATLTSSGGTYNMGVAIPYSDTVLTLENVNTDVRNSSLFMQTSGNTVTVSGGVFKGAGSSATGAIIAVQGGTNNTITVTGAELRLTTSNGQTSGNGHIVYLQGAGNVVNFVNCRFYVNGSEMAASQIAGSSRFVVQNGSQIQVNGVKVK